jgi:hypothetical protein
MVIYMDLFWDTSQDPLSFKNLANVDIMVVACPLQDYCCISCGDYDDVHFQLYYIQTILLLRLFFKILGILNW